MQTLTYLPYLLQGLAVTIALVFAALFVGFSLASLMTLACMTNSPFLKWPVKGFIFVIRGTPLLIQIFLIYYGTTQFEWLKDSSLWIIFKYPFSCAVIALALNSSAYTTELFLGAIRSIPKGEIEACHAYGMTWFGQFRRIIFPRALRIALPGYSNEVIMLIKASSLSSAITLLDLMGMTQQIINETYNSLLFFTIAGILYLLLNGLSLAIFKRIEKRSLCYLLRA